MKISIFSKIWPEAIEELKSKHECLISINPKSEEKKRLIKDAEIVIIRSPVKLDVETLDAAKNLKLILRAGMGLDAVDVKYAKEKSIQIVVVPLSAQSVAEHILALILSIYRHIPWFYQSLKENKWEKHSFFSNEIYSKKLGLIGFGRIGIKIAEIAKGFNMDIYAYDRSPEKLHKEKAAKKLDVKFVGIDELFKTSDIISIQTPLNEETKNIVDVRRINLMKETAIIINIGRGGVIDEKALYSALKEKRIAGAALDVFAEEPAKDNPLLKLDNFVGTPHVGSQTIEAQKKIGGDVLKIINAFEQGLDLDEYCIVV